LTEKLENIYAQLATVAQVVQIYHGYSVANLWFNRGELSLLRSKQPSWTFIFYFGHG